MNTIFIVLPILCLLMFALGLELEMSSFKNVMIRPCALIVGIIGQIVLLPLIAFLLGMLFELPPLFFIGIMLIACSPGGSSSNIFSMLAGGNVALSVSLTAISSVITMFTIPLIMSFALSYTYDGMQSVVQLPVGKLLFQNLLLMFLPMLAGWGVRRRWPRKAEKVKRILGKISFPALILLASIFFVQHRETIVREFDKLGMSLFILIISALCCATILGFVFRLKAKERRTIVIEVGMQNAAQAIAVACSPFIFNNEVIAIPAIIYALLMNVVLLLYVWTIRINKSNMHLQ